MEENSFNKEFEKTSKGLDEGTRYLFIATIILALLGSNKKSSRYMFQMIRSLSIIIHLPIMRIIYPANLMAFYSILIPITQFDIIDSKFDWEKDQKILKF